MSRRLWSRVISTGDPKNRYWTLDVFVSHATSVFRLRIGAPTTTHNGQGSDATIQLRWTANPERDLDPRPRLERPSGRRCPRSRHRVGRSREIRRRDLLQHRRHERLSGLTRSCGPAQGIAIDGLVESLAAYDSTGQLEPRWIVSNLTDEQLVLILHRIQQAHS